MSGLVKEAAETTNKELSKLIRKSGMMSDGTVGADVAVGRFKLCKLSNFGDIYATCNLNYSAKGGLRGFVMLDSQAGVSLGLLKFAGNVAEMYNNGMQKGVLFLNSDVYSAGEMMFPGRVRVPYKDIETLDVSEDLTVMMGFSLGTMSTVRL